MWILVAILLIVLIIWGIDAGLQNIATATQAQATVETARAAQIASIGNMIIILLVTLIILALLVLAGYMAFLRTKKTPQKSQPVCGEITTPEPRMLDMNQVMQVIVFKILNDMMSKPQAQAQNRSVEMPDENERIAWR